MDWKRWEVEYVGLFPSAVIEAPSKHIAIEFYLVTNKIEGNGGTIRCEPTEKPLYGSREDVSQRYSLEVHDLEASYGRFAVAANVMDAAQGSFGWGPYAKVWEAAMVEPSHPHAVICEIRPEDKTIIKHYWNGDQWVVAGDLSILEADDHTICYGFPGIFELAGVPALPFMRAHDQIIDYDGKGRIVYVHRCAQCGRSFARNAMAWGPAFCGQCKVGEWTPERTITL